MRIPRNIIAVGVALGLLAVPVSYAAINAGAASDTNKLYLCVNQANHAQRTAAVATTTCRDGWILKSFDAEDVVAAPTTTQPATTQPGTTQPATTTTQPTNYRSAVMADTPLAYWRFGTTSSETGSHNGTLRGSPVPLLGQPGPFFGSQSIRFDGIQRDNATTQGFLADSIARLTSTAWANGFTAEAWVKTTTSGPEQHVFSWTNGAGDSGVRIFYDDPDNRWRYGDGNLTLTQNSSTTINEWHHLVATVDASGNGRLYVDGQQDASWSNGLKPVASSTGLFTVGADYDSHDCPCPRANTPFDGWIAEVAVYNRPLTPARVQAHFGAGTGTTTTTTQPATTTTTQPGSTGAFLSYPRQSGPQTFSGNNVVVANKSWTNSNNVCLTVQNANNVYIHDVDFDSCVGGIFLINVTGNIRIENVRARNIGDGTIGSGHSNVIQLNNAWQGATNDGVNGIRNIKALGGDTEDVISIFQSGGIDPQHPLIIENVHVEHPLTGPLAWSSDSGTCANLADAGGHDIILRDSTFLNCGAVGIQMNEPTRVRADNNIVYGAARPLSNVGLSQWADSTCSGCTGNFYTNNRAWWVKSNGTASSIWLHGSYPVTQTGNISQDATINPNSLKVTL